VAEVAAEVMATVGGVATAAAEMAGVAEAAEATVVAGVAEAAEATVVVVAMEAHIGQLPSHEGGIEILHLAASFP
jgi:hypothetical protein